MSPQDRIKELKTRQIWNGHSTVVKLFKVEGIFHYKVILTKMLDEQVQGEYGFSKITLQEGIYKDEDPEELIKECQAKFGVWKCGYLIRSPTL